VSYQSTILAESSLKLFYEFSETLRPVLDASGNGNHAQGSSSGLTTGVTGPNSDGHTAMTFDGTNGVIRTRIVNPNSLTGAYTVEAVVKSGAQGNVFGTRGSPNDWGVQLYVDTTTSTSGLVANIGNGSTWLVDYKTAEHAWSHGKEHSSDQATAYIWAMQQQGQAVSGVLFIPLWSSQVGGKYTAQMELRRTLRGERTIAAYQELVAHVLWEMREAAETGCYPAKPGRQCCWCPVAHVCPMRAG
jgi:hypothetical protein